MIRCGLLHAMAKLVRTIRRSLIAPFRIFGRGLRYVFRALGRRFGRSRRARVALWAIAVLAAGALAAAYDHPQTWNHIAHTSNGWSETTRYARWLKLPTLVETPFKLGLDLMGGTHLVYEADMANIPEADRSEALSGVRDVVERRVNAFGVAEPLVQTNRTEGHYRIIAELAGIRDVNEAIRMIGETPTLDFRELPEGTSAPTPAFEYTEVTPEMKEFNEKAEAVALELIGRARKGEDFAALAREHSEDPGSAEQGGDLGFFGEGVMVPEFEAGVWNLDVGELNTNIIKSSFGYHIIKKTDERTVEGKKEVRASHILVRTQEGEVKTSGGDGGWVQTALSGKQLKRSQVVFDPSTGEPTVQLTFNDEGSTLFEEITERNVGRQVGIFLDGQAISAPTVQQKITGGTAIISGGFALEEAKTLSRRLNAGALPVPIALVSQQTVDASLGSASLSKSLLAGVIGFIAVVIFMLLFYRLPGLLASVALLLYAAFTIAIFKIVGVTMTLAGIAGFILSVGMAVDANVLIFERLKEELRRGRPLSDALTEGFKRAWNSIRDSNASSLITCAILVWFGTSTVRGFALTLSIGIIVSMFSAITVTRTFLRLIVSPALERRLWLLGSGLKKRV